MLLANRCAPEPAPRRKKAVRFRTASMLPTNSCLPVELEAYLDLAGQDVLRRNAAREDRAEMAIGLVRGRVDLVAAEVVVVEQIERFETKLDAGALADLRGLEERRVELHCLVAANLTRPERGETLREVRGLLDPGVVAPVVAEV